MHESYAVAQAAAAGGAAPVSLSACLETYLQPEQLGEDDTWYCPKCKDHVQARWRPRLRNAFEFETVFGLGVLMKAR